MNATFLQLLVHPVHKTPLSFDEKTNELFDPVSNDRFKIKEGVPLLLTHTLYPELAETEKNKQAGTTFSYKEHYQTDAEVYNYEHEDAHPVEQTEINRLRENILFQIPEHAKTILDIGCGGAWLANALLPKGKTVISTDISDINPIKAVKRVPSLNHLGLVADVFELPLKENSIDCIVASEIIEHVPNPKKFIDSLFYVLKPGGKLIITTPYNELIRTSLCIHCNRETPHNAHLHSFNEKIFISLIPEQAKGVKIHLLNSKLLVKIYLQYFLRFLPVSIWNSIDRFFIFLTKKKAYRILVSIEK